MPRARSNKFEPSQADSRRFSRFRDQHGRLWQGVIELSTGHPTGALTPAGWRAPLIPPQKYFKFPRLSDGTFTINYKQWIADREESKRTFERRKVKAAKTLYGEQAGQMLKKMPAELVAAVGTEPEEVEPVLAASAGNKWVLGLSPNKPKWANKFFTDEVETIRLNNTKKSTFDIEDDELLDMFPDAEDVEVELELGGGK